MENKTQISELGLPQIRQMVLENSQRIDKNELMIKEMRMKQEEESRKRREREEHLADIDRKFERAREEHDREMRELREMMNNHFIHLEEDRKKDREEREQWKKDREAERKKREKENEKWRKEREAERKKREEENEKWRKECKAKWKKREEENEKWRKEHEAERKKRDEAWEKWQKERDEKFDIQMAHIDASIDKINQYAAETREAVKKLSSEFTSAIGHIVEGLLGPKGHEMFATAGFKVDRYCKDMYRKIKEQNIAMEVDVLSYGEDLAIATEVKTNCRKKDIDEFLEKMKLFRQLFTEHQDKEVLAAIAAINFERDAYEYAKQQGILIIHVIDESVFTIDPVPDKSTLRRF